MPFGVDAAPWLYAYAVAFALAHVALLYHVYRRSSNASGTDPSDESRSVEPPDDLPPVDADATVECDRCGVRNEGGYRFCRYCIGELESGQQPSSAEGSPRSRRMF